MTERRNTRTQENPKRNHSGQLFVWPMILQINMLSGHFNEFGYKEDDYSGRVRIPKHIFHDQQQKYLTWASYCFFCLRTRSAFCFTAFLPGPSRILLICSCINRIVINIGEDPKTFHRIRDPLSEKTSLDITKENTKNSQ